MDHHTVSILLALSEYKMHVFLSRSEIWFSFISKNSENLQSDDKKIIISTTKGAVFFSPNKFVGHSFIQFRKSCGFFPESAKKKTC